MMEAVKEHIYYKMEFGIQNLLLTFVKEILYGIVNIPIVMEVVELRCHDS